MEVIDLIAPNGCRISGALAADGSVRSFRYSYDRGTQLRLYVLDDGTELPDAPVRLVASDGTQWDSTDVEWHTLFKSRSQSSRSSA